MIKTWQQRCENHEGIVTNQMILDRMQEEINELRKAAEMALDALETLDVGDSYKTHNAASALRQALAASKNAQPVTESLTPEERSSDDLARVGEVGARGF